MYFHPGELWIQFEAAKLWSDSGSVYLDINTGLYGTQY